MAKNVQKTVNEIILSILDKGQAHGIDVLNEKQRIVFLVVELDNYINMEGLTGFYPGVGGGQAVEAVEALGRIGASESAKLMQRANALFPGSAPPADVVELHKILNELDESTFKVINDIGRQFLLRPDNLEKKLEDYILGNIKELSK